MKKLLVVLTLLTFSLFATPLHQAVNEINLKKVEAVLKSGVAINAQDEQGNTALHDAARIGRISILKALLAYHPKVFIENFNGDTALGLAIEYNNIGAVNLLIAAQKTQKKEVHYTPLQQYVMDSNLRMTGRYLDVGYSVESPDTHGITLLQLALANRRYTMAKYLISRGADVCHYDDEHRDALYYVQRSRGKKMTQYIKKLRKQCE